MFLEIYEIVPLIGGEYVNKKALVMRMGWMVFKVKDNW